MGFLVFHIILLIFEQSFSAEFEKLEPVQLYNEQYNVTRTVESFNISQLSFTKLYFVEPNGEFVQPFVHLIVIKDLSTGENYVILDCFYGIDSYRIENNQVLEHLKNENCLEETSK